MGKVMAALKARYAGQMDSGSVSAPRQGAVGRRVPLEAGADRRRARPGAPLAPDRQPLAANSPQPTGRF